MRGTPVQRSAVFAEQGQLSHDQVWRMLDECALGWERKETPHHYRITYRDRTFHNFPRGERKRRTLDVQIFWVRKLARHLGIEECARRVLPQLT